MYPNAFAGIGRAMFFPERFFRDNRPNLDDAGRVVLGVAIVHLLVSYLVLLGGAVLVSRQQSDGVAELLADLGPEVYALGPAIGLTIVLDWLLVSAVLHLAIKLLHGEGTYGDTLSVVGQSAPATLLGLLVVVLGFGLALWENSLVMSFDAKLAAAVPTVALAGVVGGLLTLLWQGYIWPAGLTAVHDVEGAAAGKATGLTVIVGAVALLTTL